MMSGSIACVKASSLISDWTKQGHTVRVACTRSVSSFIGPARLQGLGAELVFDNVFAEGQAMEHISLGKWADIVVIAPATSNLINKLSAGIADDAVTTLWQAAYGLGKPMMIVPAMNMRMWRYPATRESLARLKQWGIHVLPVASGLLACGETGEGRMLEPAAIQKAVSDLLIENRPARDNTSAGKQVLLTAGGTRERIDSVRYLGNMSSGRTAATLADALAHAGHQVTWLGTDHALQPEAVECIEKYSDFSSLKQQLQHLLADDRYDTVIHAAAVSDFSVDSVDVADGTAANVNGGKLSSDSDLVIRLKRNPKLLHSLKRWSGNPSLQVVGFKLTDNENIQQRLDAVRRQLAHPSVDAVVHNDLSDISETHHSFCLHFSGQSPLVCENNAELAAGINQWME